jgi:hypothetical protein
MGCIHAVQHGLLGSACLSIALAGCAGSGSGLDANGRPLTSTPSAPLPLAATFDSLQENIFTPICTACHIGASAPQGLRLDSANSYALLVGVPSTEVPSILRVKPGDPDNSYIVQKLEGHAAVGAQMPFGGPYLPSSTIAFVRQWITDGAQPAAAAAIAASDAPLTIVTSTPSTGDILEQSPPQVMIGFNRPLDVTRLDQSSARLERLSAPPGTIPVRLSVVPANPATLTLWPERALQAGRYRVILTGGDADVIVTTFDVGAAE